MTHEYYELRVPHEVQEYGSLHSYIIRCIRVIMKIKTNMRFIRFTTFLSFASLLTFLLSVGALPSAHAQNAPVAEQRTDTILLLGVDVRQQQWNTFHFIAATNHPEAIITWNFGDGTNAGGKEVTHRFRDPSRYVVSAVASAPGGLEVQKKVVLRISFWHLGNWQLLVILASLVAVAVVLLLLARDRVAERNYAFATGGDGEDNADDDAEGLPPVLRALRRNTTGKETADDQTPALAVMDAEDGDDSKKPAVVKKKLATKKKKVKKKTTAKRAPTKKKSAAPATETATKAKKKKTAKKKATKKATTMKPATNA